jgi:hypothetical protein
MGDYPADWAEIAARVKREAGQRCEHCGHPDERETWHVLTVHHLDGDKSNCAPENLVALCQRCHLHIQHRFIVGQIVMEIFRPDWMRKRGLGNQGSGNQGSGGPVS